MSVIDKLNENVGKTPDEIVRALRPVPEITFTLDTMPFVEAIRAAHAIRWEVFHNVPRTAIA